MNNIIDYLDIYAYLKKNNSNDIRLTKLNQWINVEDKILSDVIKQIFNILNKVDN